MSSLMVSSLRRRSLARSLSKLLPFWLTTVLCNPTFAVPLVLPFPVFVLRARRGGGPGPSAISSPQYGFVPVGSGWWYASGSSSTSFSLAFLARFASLCLLLLLA